MRVTLLAIGLLASALLLNPGIEAVHGTPVVYKTDDNRFSATGVFVPSDGPQMRWFFVTSQGVQCQAFGTIETGILGGCITAGGTHHFHAFPHLGVDVHPVIVNDAPGLVVTSL